MVIFIGLSLVKFRQIKTVARATRSDAFAFAVTLVVGLVFSLQLAIFSGVITSILLFLRKVAQPQLVEYGYTAEGDLAEASVHTKRAEPEVFIVHVEGELFFAAADLFYEQIRRVGEDPNQKVLVLKNAQCPQYGRNLRIGTRRIAGIFKRERLSCNSL